MIEQFYEKYPSDNDAETWLAKLYNFYYATDKNAREPFSETGCLLNHNEFFNRVLNEEQKTIQHRIRTRIGTRKFPFYIRNYWELLQRWEKKTLDLELYSEDEWKILHQIIFQTLPFSIKTYLENKSVVEVCTVGSEAAIKAQKEISNGAFKTKEPTTLYTPFNEERTALHVPYKAVEWTNITLKRTVEEDFGNVLAALIRKLNLDITYKGMGVTISGRGAEDTVGIGVCLKGAVPGLCLGGEINTETSEMETVDIKVLLGRSIESGMAKVEGTASVTFGWYKDEGKYIDANLEGNLNMVISKNIHFNFAPTIGFRYKEGPIATNRIKSGWHLDPYVKITGQGSAADTFEIEGNYEIDPVDEKGTITMRVLDYERDADVSEMRKKWRDIAVEKHRGYTKLGNMKKKSEREQSYPMVYNTDFKTVPDKEFGGIKIFGGLIEIHITPKLDYKEDNIKSVDIDIKAYGFNYTISNIDRDYWMIGEFLFRLLNKGALDALTTVFKRHRLWNEMIKFDKKRKESEAFWRKVLRQQHYGHDQKKSAAPEKIVDVPFLQSTKWFENNESKYCYCFYADAHKNNRDPKYQWTPCNNVPNPIEGYEWRFGSGTYSGPMNWDGALRQYRIKYGEGYNIVELKIGSPEHKRSQPLR